MSILKIEKMRHDKSEFNAVSVERVGTHMLDHRVERCPVCGMKADGGHYATEYQKMYFHFCSEQRRDNFNAHPRLYSGALYRAREECLKQRVLHLAEPVDDEVAALLVSYLKEMMGIRKAAVAGDKLSITYDLLQVSAVQVERKLNEAGVQLGDGWLLRLRRAWIYNSEETELGNLAASLGACCNRPPPGV